MRCRQVVEQHGGAHLPGLAEQHQRPARRAFHGETQPGDRRISGRRDPSVPAAAMRAILSQRAPSSGTTSTTRAAGRQSASCGKAKTITSVRAAPRAAPPMGTRRLAAASAATADKLPIPARTAGGTEVGRRM